MRVSKLQYFFEPLIKRRDTLLVFVIANIALAFICWQFGQEALKAEDVFSEQKKVIYPTIATLVTLIGPFLVVHYIDSEVKEAVKAYRKDIEENDRTRTDTSISRQRELEYISSIAVTKKERKELFSVENMNDSIDLKEISPSVRDDILVSCQTSLEEVSEEVQGRRVALASLFSHPDVLQGIALKAGIFTLNKSEDFDPMERRFLTDIYIYLRAWLICSLTANTYMAVSVVKQRYSNREAYIMALSYIKDNVFRGEKINELIFSEFQDKDSVDLAKKCVRTYLKYLIKEISRDSNR